MSICKLSQSFTTSSWEVANFDVSSKLATAHVGRILDAIGLLSGMATGELDTRTQKWDIVGQS